MFRLLGPVRSLILALQADSDPRHIAAGFALGAMLGLVPKGNLFGLAFFLFFFFFNVDKSMAVLSALLFTPIGYLLDGVAHAIGRALLSAGPLKPLWTALYDLPIVPLTRFNNTVVLGNVVLGLLLFWPLYRLFLRVVHAYHARYRDRVGKWKIVQVLKGSRLYDLYQRWLAP